MRKFDRFFLISILFLTFLTAFQTFAQESGKEALYIQAIKADPNNETAHLNLGIVYLNDGKFDQAIPEFEKCLQLKSNDADAREYLELCHGMVARSKNDYTSAITHFENALKTNPGDPNAKRFLLQCQAKVYMDGKDYPKAVTILSEIIQDDPKNFTAYQSLGAVYFQQKDYKKAVEYWNQAVKYEEDPQVYKFLGSSYYNLGDFNQAIANYTKSIQLEKAKDPRDQDKDSLDDTYYNLGVAYNDNASFDEAAAAFANAANVNPKDSNALLAQAGAIKDAVNAHLQKATNFMLNNQYSAVISEAQKALNLQSDNKQAQDFVQNAKAKLDSEVDYHYSKGKVYYQKGNTLQALNEWNLALQMDPNNPKVQKAVKNLKVTRLSRVKALLDEGDEYYSERDYSSALSSYSKAKEVDPHNSLVKMRLKKLLSKQASEVDSLYTKALHAYSKGDLKTAQKNITLAKEIAPNDEKIGDVFFKIQKDISLKVKSLDEEGVSLFESGDKEKSKMRFEEVLRLKSNDDTANDYVKRLTGQQAHEMVDAEKVKTLYYEGVNLYINGKIHEAIEKWQECKKLDPNSVNAQTSIDKAMVKLQSIEKLSHN